MLKVSVASSSRAKSRRITAGTVLVYPSPAAGRGRSGVPASRAGASRRAAVPAVGGAARRAEAPAVELRSYLFYLAVAFALAVALSWSHSMTARLGYRIGELQTEIAQLEREHEKLSFDLAALESMTRVEAEATLRLGLIHPEYLRVAGAPADRSGDVVTPTATVIRLTATGTALAGEGELAAGAEGAKQGPGLVGSLWERLYRWLTGISQAEAGAWN